MSIRIELSKEKFRDFEIEQKPTSLFLKSWYLDACFGDKWTPLLVYKKDLLIGATAFPNKKEYSILNTSITKVLFPYISIWLNSDSSLARHSFVSRQIEVYTAVAKHLNNSFHRVNLKLDHQVDNWLPFFWNGFNQTTNYTYIIPSSIKIEKLRKEYSTLTRRTLKKGLQNEIQIEISEDLSLLEKFVSQSFEKQGAIFKIDFEYVTRVFNEAVNRNAAQLNIAKTKEGEFGAAALLIRDEKMSYYMLGGSDPKLRNTGMVTSMFDKMIEETLNQGLDFNFEGSMIEGISDFFRSFGSELYPCHKVYKSNHLAFKIKDAINTLM